MYTIQLLLEGQDAYLTREFEIVPFSQLQERDLFCNCEDVVAEATEAQLESYEITGKSDITVKLHQLTKFHGELVKIGQIENFEEEFLSNLKVHGFGKVNLENLL